MKEDASTPALLRQAPLDPSRHTFAVLIASLTTRNGCLCLCLFVCLGGVRWQGEGESPFAVEHAELLVKRLLDGAFDAQVDTQPHNPRC